MYEAFIYKNEWDYLHGIYQYTVYIDYIPKASGDLTRVDYTWGILSLIYNLPS